jgi:hypothetical protein
MFLHWETSGDGAATAAKTRLELRISRLTPRVFPVPFDLVQSNAIDEKERSVQSLVSCGSSMSPTNQLGECMFGQAMSLDTII